jgi:hypothetical protein
MTYNDEAAQGGLLGVRVRSTGIGRRCQLLFGRAIYDIAYCDLSEPFAESPLFCPGSADPAAYTISRPRSACRLSKFGALLPARPLHLHGLRHSAAVAHLPRLWPLSALLALCQHRGTGAVDADEPGGSRGGGHRLLRSAPAGAAHLPRLPRSMWPAALGPHPGQSPDLSVYQRRALCCAFLRYLAPAQTRVLRPRRPNACSSSARARRAQ